MARGFQEMEAVGYADTKGNAQRLEGRRGVGAPFIRHVQKQRLHLINPGGLKVKSGDYESVER